jgi:hypothetical protein
MQMGNSAEARGKDGAGRLCSVHLELSGSTEPHAARSSDVGGREKKEKKKEKKERVKSMDSMSPPVI